jgi:hypothetical protein
MATNTTKTPAELALAPVVDALPGQLMLLGKRCPHCGSSHVQVSQYAPAYYCLTCGLYDGEPDPGFKPKHTGWRPFAPLLVAFVLAALACARDRAGDDLVDDAGCELPDVVALCIDAGDPPDKCCLHPMTTCGVCQ